jgi:hypothetical protein
MKSSLRLSAFLCVLSLFLGCTKDNDVPDIDPQPPVANAGTDLIVQMPSAPFTLTGGGTTTNGKIVGYLWSLVSGPNVPTITSPASASTTVTGFVGGSYIFQFMVVDSAGLTGVDTTSVQVLPAPIQTLTLQPANNDNEKFLLGNGSTIDESSHPGEFSAGTWTIGGVVVYERGLFKFDLSSIPAGSTILSAKLSLYANPTPLNGDLVHANSGTDNSFFIQRVTSNWDPASTLFSNQPATTTTNEVSVPHTALPYSDVIDADVTALVSDMLQTANYGFGIRLQNEVIYNIRDFCSSTNPDATKHPKLVITYQ